MTTTRRTFWQVEMVIRGQQEYAQPDSKNEAMLILLGRFGQEAQAGETARIIRDGVTDSSWIHDGRFARRVIREP
jgi:hypothetical protein